MERDSTAPGGRLLLLTAVLSLAVVATAGFGRVFQGTRATVVLAAAAAAAVLLAALLERTHVLVATVASAAGLAVAVGLLVYPDTTWHGLPTAETLRAARQSWEAVGRTAQAEVAPALPVDPLMLASVTAVWAASFAAHAMAVRAASPFLALVPTGALLAFASLVVDDGPRPPYVVAFLAAAMTLLFADALRRVAQWGPISVWRGPRRFRLVRAGHARTARRLAAVCLGLAVLAPGILPGFRSPGLVLVRGEGTPDRVALDPTVDIRPSLLRNPPIQVFTVRADRPAYWRVTASDTFNGRAWVNTDARAAGGREVRDGMLKEAPPGGLTIRQHVVIDRLFDVWVPAALDPVQIAADGPLRYDPATSTIVAPDRVRRGFTYDVVSRVPAPTAADLDRITEFDPQAVARYTQLPPIPAVVHQIARDLTRDQPTPYRKILAIQSYLRRFEYSERVPPGQSTDYLVRFLTETRAGYCQQFAGTMAVLLRSLGIPARVAVGFTYGTYDPRADLWRVTTQNAHSWVEVLFPRYGWLAFEPTPSRGNPAAATYQFPPLEPGVPAECLVRPGGRPVLNSCDTEAAAPTSPPREAAPSSPAGPRDPGVVAPPPVPRGEAGRPAGPGALVPWVGAGLALLVLVAVPAVRTGRRRRLLTRPREDPGERVVAAYRFLAEHAGDLGLARRPHETLWEYRTRLRDRVPFSDGHLDRLTALAGRAVYSARTVDPDDAWAAVEAARQATRDLHRWAGWPRRVAGLYRVRLPGGDA